MIKITPSGYIRRAVVIGIAVLVWATGITRISETQAHAQQSAAGSYVCPTKQGDNDSQKKQRCLYVAKALKVLATFRSDYSKKQPFLGYLQVLSRMATDCLNGWRSMPTAKEQACARAETHKTGCAAPSSRLMHFQNSYYAKLSRCLRLPSPRSVKCGERVTDRVVPLFIKIKKELIVAMNRRIMPLNAEFINCHICQPKKSPFFTSSQSTNHLFDLDQPIEDEQCKIDEPIDDPNCPEGEDCNGGGSGGTWQDPTPTYTPTVTPTPNECPGTEEGCWTATPTPTQRGENTSTPTASATPTRTATRTPTATASFIVTRPAVPTPTNSATSTPYYTSTPQQAATRTQTPTQTATTTPAIAPTTTFPPPPAITFTATPIFTVTPFSTRTATPNATPSASASPLTTNIPQPSPGQTR